jgi:hypothetical protein
VLVLAVSAVCVGLLARNMTTANPGHFAGDYVIYARANADGITDSAKAYEPNCNNGTNDGQAQTSGETNTFYGRIHSYADLQLTGASRYEDTISPDPEITYGVNDNAPPPSADPYDC